MYTAIDVKEYLVDSHETTTNRFFTDKCVKLI